MLAKGDQAISGLSQDMRKAQRRRDALERSPCANCMMKKAADFYRMPPPMTGRNRINSLAANRLRHGLPSTCARETMAKNHFVLPTWTGSWTADAG